MNNLKRYKLGREAIAKAGNHALMCAGIVADKDGDYYKGEDVDALLESIGAGGVSGRITQKTIEQHRGEFEAAYARMHQPDEPVYLSRSPVVFSSAGLGFLYINEFTQHAWEIWAMARGLAE